MTKIALAVLVASIGFGSVSGAPMSQDDRQHLIAHLEMTESWLHDEVSGLSPAQLNFRYAPGRWTILEVVEHLTITEPEYWADIQKDMKQPPSQVKEHATEADMLWYGIDRSERQKTGPAEEPKGKLKDVHEGLANFQKLRAEMLEYARTTNDDLKAHADPDWQVDCYLVLLGTSTHAQRHILQIREIKAQPGYPKQ
ncbi:MAG: DinB family protein [Bryobacteraceae bacterium]|jgi:hypothetical protein